MTVKSWSLWFMMVVLIMRGLIWRRRIVVMLRLWWCSITLTSSAVNIVAIVASSNVFIEHRAIPTFKCVLLAIVVTIMIDLKKELQKCC